MRDGRSSGPTRQRDEPHWSALRLEHAAMETGEGELRCGCGSLLARVVERALELKCRRCKQTWRVPLGR